MNSRALFDDAPTDTDVLHREPLWVPAGEFRGDDEPPPPPPIDLPPGTFHRR